MNSWNAVKYAIHFFTESAEDRMKRDIASIQHSVAIMQQDLNQLCKETSSKNNKVTLISCHTMNDEKEKKDYCSYCKLPIVKKQDMVILPSIDHFIMIHKNCL